MLIKYTYIAIYACVKRIWFFNILHANANIFRNTDIGRMKACGLPRAPIIKKYIKTILYLRMNLALL